MNVAYFVVQQTMYFAIPLLIVAIGAMYSERSGVINIALEGIMVMGAFAGIFFINIFQGTLSGQGLFLLAMLVAGLTGGLFSLLHAFASINMKADQTISGTALNLFAPAFAIFTARMIQGMQQIQFTDTFHINKVPVLGDIPVIGDLFFQNCYISTYIGILIFAVAAFVIKNTRFGLRLRACGEHPGAADSVGVNVYKIRYAGVIISGVLGGIGGLIFVVQCKCSRIRIFGNRGSDLRTVAKQQDFNGSILLWNHENTLQCILYDSIPEITADTE